MSLDATYVSQLPRSDSYGQSHHQDESAGALLHAGMPIAIIVTFEITHSCLEVTIKYYY